MGKAMCRETAKAKQGDAVNSKRTLTRGECCQSKKCPGVGGRVGPGDGAGEPPAAVRKPTSPCNVPLL